MAESSAEYSAYFDVVQQLYIGFYQRPADPEGLLFWASALASTDANEDGDLTGDNFTWVINEFVRSDETKAIYGDLTSATISGVVDQIYVNLFNRHAEAEGLAFWVNAWNIGTATEGDILWQILTGAQNQDELSVDNKTTAAMQFTQVLDPELDGRPPFQATFLGTADNDAVVAWLAAVNSDGGSIPNVAETVNFVEDFIADPGDPIFNYETFTLTAGTDAINGTILNDKIIGTFGGAVPTFNAGDSINGDGGNNVLDLVVAGTTPSAAVPVSNVQTINVTDTVGGTLDAILFTGDPSINFSSTVTGKTSTVNNAALASTMGLAGAGNLTVDYANTAGTSDTANISLTGVGTSAAATSTVDVTNANTIEAVNIATSGTNFATLNAGFAAGTITVTGTGTNTLIIGSDKITSTIDASASTGTNTFDLGTTLSNGDVIKGGTGADTAMFTAAGALGTTTFTGVETVTGSFGATGATLNLGTSTGINTLNVTDATVDMSIIDAAVPTMNFGKAASTAAVEVGLIDLKGATSTTINAVNGANWVNIDEVEATHSPDVNLTFNTGDGGMLDVATVETAKSLGDITLNVGVGGSGSLDWVSAGVGSHGDIGSITENVGVNGSGYINSATYSGSIGDVTLKVLDDGTGVIYASASAFSGTGPDNYGGGGNIGDVTITASGSDGYASGYFSAGSGNIGNVTMVADGTNAQAYGDFYASEWSGGAAAGNAGTQPGDIGNIDVQSIGDGAYVSGYFAASGGLGNVNFAVSGAVASGYLDAYGYSGTAGNINMSTNGFEASGEAYVSAGLSVGDVTMSLNGASASAYYEVYAGTDNGGNVGTVSFDVRGSDASGYAYVAAYEGAAGDGNIGNATLTVGDNVYDAYLELDASGSVGTASITVGSDAYASAYTTAYSGDIGAVTATVGEDSYFSGYFSAGGDVGNITVSTGNGSTIYVDAYGTDVGDITVTSAPTAITADASVYVDADILNSVNLGGFAGTYDINASAVTNATVLTGGQGGGTILGGAGADVITGGAKADTLTGNGGSDTIVGLAGDDTIDGGAGGDVLYGNAGADALTGGTEADVFGYISFADTGITLATADTIADFVSGTDKVKTGIAGTAANYVEAAAAADFATALAAANTAFATAGVTYYMTSDTADATGLLFMDATPGDGTADAVIKLTGVTDATFAATDIIV